MEEENAGRGGGMDRSVTCVGGDEEGCGGTGRVGVSAKSGVSWEESGV